MREIRTRMASSAFETTSVAGSVDDKKTEEQQTSEALVQRTDVATVAYAANEACVESMETAICNSCVTLKAKVVSLQKKCLRLRQKAAGPSAVQIFALFISDDPCIDSSNDEESEPSSEIRTNDPPSQTSIDPKAEGSESSEILTQSEDDENESRNKIRSVFSAVMSICKNLQIVNNNSQILIGLTQDNTVSFS